MPCRLREEEIMTIRVLAQKGVAQTEVARQLGVCEGTVRYHLRREATGATDGRKDKPFEFERLEGPSVCIASLGVCRSNRRDSTGCGCGQLRGVS